MSNNSTSSVDFKSVQSQASTKNSNKKLAPFKEFIGIETKENPTFVFVGLLCLLIAFGGFVFGWDTGTISGFVNMSDFKRRFGQVDEQGVHYLSSIRVGLMISIFNVGCAIGGIILSKLADWHGRKLGISLSMIFYTIGIIIQISSQTSWVQYFMGRIIAGLGVGCVAVISPMFISETSPKQIRGILVSCYQLMITLGIFLGYCTTYGTKSYSDSVQWRVPLGLSFVWALLLVVGMSFLPESPRYLVAQGKFDEARKSIAKVNKVSEDDDSVVEEINLINDSIDNEKKSAEGSWKVLITGKPRIFYRVVVGVVLQSLQQLTGINYFFYYSTTIFSSIGMDDSFITSIILGVVNFVSTFVAFFVIDRFGRRKTLIGGGILMALCLLIFASVGCTTLYPNGYSNVTDKTSGNVMIAFTCIYIFGFANTWGPGVFVVVSETYTKQRPRAMGISTAANWIFGFVISLVTPFITKAIHFAYGYVFFGCLVFGIVFVFFFVPETKGLSLEEVDDLYARFTPGLAFEKMVVDDNDGVQVANSPV